MSDNGGQIAQRVSKVFVSYNSQDNDSVQELLNGLRQTEKPVRRETPAARSFDCKLEFFFADESLKPGDKWRQEIKDRIATCDYFLATVGRHGLGPYHAGEIEFAHELLVTCREKPIIIPIILPGGLAHWRDCRFLFQHLSRIEFCRFVRDETEVTRRLQAFLLGKETPCSVRSFEITAQTAAVWNGQESNEPAAHAGYLPSNGTVPGYPGLSALDESSAALYCGREDEVHRILARISELCGDDRRRPRVVSIIGPSGRGKSSLAKAGVLPRLRAGAIPTSESWPIIRLSPGGYSADPVYNLAIACHKAQPSLGLHNTPPDTLSQRLCRGPDELSKILADFFSNKPAETRVVILVDQLEELLTCPNHNQRDQFIALVRDAATGRGGRAIIITTIPSNAISSLDRSCEFQQAVIGNGFHLGPLQRDQLEDIIRYPASRLGCSVEPQLVDELVTEVTGNQDSLPLLEYTLTELWNRRKENALMTLGSYRDCQGLKGCLNDVAERVYKRLSTSQQAACERILMNLVADPSKRYGLIKRVARPDLMMAVGGSSADINVVIDELIVARVIVDGLGVFGDEMEPGGATLESARDSNVSSLQIAHEALVHGWDRMKTWVKAREADFEFKNDFDRQCQKWEKTSDPKHRLSLLLRGVGLKNVLGWNSRKDLKINVDHDLVRTSIRARRRHIVAYCGLVGLAALAAGFGWNFHNRRMELGEMRKAIDLGGVQSLIQTNWILPHGRREALQELNRTIQVEAGFSSERKLRLLKSHLARMMVLDRSSSDSDRESQRSSLDYVVRSLIDLPPTELGALLEFAGGHLRTRNADLSRLFELSRDQPNGRTARLNYAAVLAHTDRDSSKWPELARVLVEDLRSETNAAQMTAWLDLLKPVYRELAPAVSESLTGLKSGTSDEKDTVGQIASAVATDSPETRLGLIQEAVPTIFNGLFTSEALARAPVARRYRDLRAEWEELSRNDFDQALAERFRSRGPQSIGRDDEDALKSHLQRRLLVARRLVNCAVILIKTESSKAAWDLLDNSPDNTLRTELIHRLALLQVPIQSVLFQLKEALSLPDKGRARSLVQALGEYSVKDFPQPEMRDNWFIDLASVYERGDDPGLHASLYWLLGRWRLESQRDAIDDKVTASFRKLNLEQRLALIERRGWFHDSLGSPLTVIKKPGEVQIGSGFTEQWLNLGKDSVGRENRHLVRIPRRYAIGMTEVRLQLFQQFLQELSAEEKQRLARRILTAQPNAERDQAATAPPNLEEVFRIDSKYSPEPKYPVNSLIWYVAARFCNWLSEKEGFGPDQLCYRADDFGPGMRPVEDYLERLGYRIPSEPEWEYAARAGSETSRFFGDSLELGHHYSLFNSGSSAPRMLIVPGTLKPNDFGLFDVLGNCDEWCHGRFSSWKGLGIGADPIDDSFDLTPIGSTAVQYVARGGSLVARDVYVRSANRYALNPDNTMIQNRNCIGLRVARTLPETTE